MFEVACEIIATYNAMIIANNNNKEADFCRLAVEFETNAIKDTGILTRGKFGSDPERIFDCLKAFNYEFTMYTTGGYNFAESIARLLEFATENSQEFGMERGKSNTIIYAKDQDVWHIYADNGCLFYRIASEKLKCLDIKTGETKDAIELLNDKSDGFYKQRFSDDKWIIASLTGGELASFEICDDDMTLLFTTSDKSGGFVEKGN